MCLVTYLPRKEGFILSSNRDESPKRNATEIVAQKIGIETITYPVDTKNGSWIYMSDQMRVVCLLNGAFDNHIRRLPYKMSRGIMLKKFFEYPDAISFFELFGFDNIEPFTMIIVDRSRLFEFRWDGQLRHINELDNDSRYVWSSCTLYDHEAVAKRAQLFLCNMELVDIHDKEAVFAAHLTADLDDPGNALKMYRGEIVQTISHTQIIHDKNGPRMEYHNFLTNQVKVKTI